MLFHIFSQSLRIFLLIKCKKIVFTIIYAIIEDQNVAFLSLESEGTYKNETYNLKI